MPPDFELRPYQHAFVTNIRKSVLEYKRVIACAATGSGKSEVFISIAMSAIEKKRTVLVISESRKIFGQIDRKLPAITIAAGSNLSFIQPGALYLSMAQTLVRRGALIQQFAALGNQLLVINDEAHIATPTKILAALPDALLIGFTATPSCKHGKHLPKLYKNIVVGPQPHDLVVEGFLSPYKHFARQPADLAKLQVKNGEYTEESQRLVFGSSKVYDGIIDDLEKVPFKKCLIFTSCIRHCDDLTSRLLDANLNCVPVHSGLGDAKESYNLAQFMTGSVPICVSVGILTKGFDFPPIDLIVLHRATTSLPLYLQMIGRGSRISPNKPHFTVLDYGDNHSRHNFWDFEHDWADLWCKEPRKKKNGVAPTKNCPECEFIVAASALECPNCGFKFERRQQVDDDTDTVLVQLTEQYGRIIGKKLSELTPTELAVYARSKNKKMYAIRIALSHEQRLPGWLAEYARAMGYKPGFVYMQTKNMAVEPILYNDLTLK